MEQLDNDYIHKSEGEGCVVTEKAPATLGLKNMAGVFILVAAGIVGGIGLIIIEIIYKKHQIAKQRKTELMRHSFDKWRGIVEKRRTLRATLEAQKRLRANGVSESQTFEKAETKALPGYGLRDNLRNLPITRQSPMRPAARVTSSTTTNNPIFTTDPCDIIV